MAGSSRASVVVVALATLIAGAMGAGATLLAGQQGKIPASILPTPTVTVTVWETITEPPSQEEEETTPSPQSFKVTYLDELDAIDSELDRRSIRWGSQTFSRSLVNDLSGCSAVGPVDYVVPENAARFLTEVGVAVESVEPDAIVTFNVFLDNRPERAATVTVGVGEHEPVELELEGAQRMRLESIIDENRRGNCNTEAIAVWGDARFVG